ncbi:Ribonuclease P protein component 1 [uncultured archaeon]|nr:Ribonuclease P protein component 1 [uncultured archaeon]
MLKSGNYCISAKNILVHEMIGLSANAMVSGKSVSGKVVDETRNTFVFEGKDGKERVVPKKGAVFEFEIGNETAIVEGAMAMYRPEQRAKALWGKGVC